VGFVPDSEIGELGLEGFFEHVGQLEEIGFGLE
jgi:hypothetical protein